MSLAQHSGAHIFLFIDMDSVCLAIPAFSSLFFLALSLGLAGNISDVRVPDAMQNNAMHVPI